MNSEKLACGDNDTVQLSSENAEVFSINSITEDSNAKNKSTNVKAEKNDHPLDNIEITPQVVNDNEMKLKERIAQCRTIIESLKYELHEEKIKLEKESKTSQKPISDQKQSCNIQYYDGINPNDLTKDVPPNLNLLSSCMESKLNCDENLMEYEKQLHRYQNTLNMAQIEKKNAIRKQMLTKAYKLKLLEVENQCNIELLRVKQSLQCLEPLRIIASKWKTNNENISYDLNNFELIPRYSEINFSSICDLNGIEAGVATKTADEKVEGNI